MLNDECAMKLIGIDLFGETAQSMVATSKYTHNNKKGC